MGLVALGVAIGTPLAVAAALLHILGHGLGKARRCSAARARSCSPTARPRSPGCAASSPGDPLLGGVVRPRAARPARPAAVQPVRQRARASPAPASPPAWAGRSPSRSCCMLVVFAAVVGHAQHMLLGEPTRRRPSVTARPLRRAVPLVAGLARARAARRVDLADRTSPARRRAGGDRMTPASIRAARPTIASTARDLADRCGTARSPTATGSRSSPATTTGDALPRRLPARRRATGLARRARTCGSTATSTRGSRASPTSPSRPAGSSARCTTSSASSPIGHPQPAPSRPPPALARGLAPDARTTPAPPPPFGDESPSRIPFLDGRRARRLRDPRRTCARRAHRTRPLPLLGRRRDDPHDEGPPVVRPQGHRAALRGSRPAGRRRARRAHLRRHRRRPQPRLLPRASRTRCGCVVPHAGQCLRARAARARTPLQPRRRHRRALQRRRLRRRQRPRAAHPRTAPAPQRRRHRPPAPARRRSSPAAPPSAQLPDHRRRSTTIAADFADIVAHRARQQHRRRPLHRHRRSSTTEQATEHRHARLRRPRLRPRPRRPHATTPSPTSTATSTSPSATTGDVLARFSVRVDEFDASIDLLRRLLDRSGRRTATAARARSTPPPHHGHGVGHRRRLARHASPTGSSSTPTAPSTRVKIVDPSFFNWPALPVALADTIVPDFPLANKSFNLSYAGNDL